MNRFMLPGGVPLSMLARPCGFGGGIGSDGSYPYESPHVSTTALCGLGSRWCVDVFPPWSKPVTRTRVGAEEDADVPREKDALGVQSPGRAHAGGEAETSARGGVARWTRDGQDTDGGGNAKWMRGCGSGAAARRRGDGTAQQQVRADGAGKRRGQTARGGRTGGAGPEGQDRRGRTGGACRRGRDAGSSSRSGVPARGRVGAGHGGRRRGGVKETALWRHGTGRDGGGGSSDELGSKRVRDAVRREAARRRDGRAMQRGAAGGKWARGHGK
ncbi:hypothetical protein B0H14DRAFT_3141341 [Mycena olivaceomarginata]|nr:hypothetical protein B0H14DRAFT_3141341 [Mycena olivaceomarginata]